jgi:hypothetical protein
MAIRCAPGFALGHDFASDTTYRYPAAIDPTSGLSGHLSSLSELVISSAALHFLNNDSSVLR